MDIDLSQDRWKYIAGGIVILILLVIIGSMIPVLYTELHPDRGRAAIISLDGAISQSQDVRSSGITPETIDSLTEKALSSQADVIIYEVNSPGGGVVASKEAARVVKEVEVPTVCLLREVAASGGYWLASACDHIVADELTLTGSIGVTSAYLEFSGLLDRYGVEYVNLTSGEFKDMGSQFKNLTPAERAKFQDILDTVHESFIEDVAANRDMDTGQVRDVATGEILLGTDAKRHGLVDTLGGKETAMDVAKNMTGTTTLKTEEYAPPQRLNLLSLLFSKVGEGIVNGLKNEQEHGLQARMELP